MRSFIAAALLALSLSAHADTVEVAGIKYETQVDLAGQKLQLNGAGIRHKFVIKVYTAGLYLKDKASTTNEALAMGGPKRFHMHMLREVDGNELGRLFTKGVEANAPRDEFVKAINGVIKFSEVFASRKALALGDTFSVDYVPGIGSTVSVNGKPALQEVIKEPEFFTALMRIWLGDKPADDGLKDALLGIKRTRSSRAN